MRCNNQLTSTSKIFILSAGSVLPSDNYITINTCSRNIGRVTPEYSEKS